jgi:hypothetical protein
MFDPTIVIIDPGVLLIHYQYNGRSDIRGGHKAIAERQNEWIFFLRFTVFAGLTILRNKQILDNSTHMIEICLIRNRLSELVGQRPFFKVSLFFLLIQVAAILFGH